MDRVSCDNEVGGIKYIRSSDPQTRAVGWIALGILVVSSVIAFWLAAVWFNQTINSVTSGLTIRTAFLVRKMASRGFVIGIDEVGRGALAGPVVVAVVLLPSRSAAAIIKSANLGILKDSKKLSAPRVRRGRNILGATQRWGSRLRASIRGDRALNISAAANRAAERAFGRLTKRAA